MTEWREVSLGEACARLRSGSNITAADIKDTGDYPVFGGNGIRGYSSESNFSGECAIIGRQGAYCGNVRFFRGSARMSEHAVVACANSQNNTQFLAYLLSTLNLGRLSGQAAQPGLSVKVLAQQQLLLPPLETQIRIASIVGVIDDLIANNRRRVEVTEEMARAIYDEWFVKFRYPGHEDVALVDSALGLIPAGWAVATIADLCAQINAGGTPKRSVSAYWSDPDVDWYKTGDLTDSILLSSSEQISSLAATKVRMFEPDTILFAIYGATIGRLGLLAGRASANQAALGLLADPAASTTEYLWFVLENLRSHLIAIAQGAAQQNVSKEKVASAAAVRPPRGIVDKFTDRVRAPWRLSHELQKQTASLTELRDLLLPKLVTGQIDVSTVDLDALVGESVA
jgi:type I restriction enzyme S subunit